nr:ATP-binding protein [Nonomuraea sp. FMUSA5-5]
MLALATSERGVGRLETLDLAQVTRQVLASRRDEAARAGVELRGRLAPAMTVGDPGLVESLVANLVDNAIRHNRAGGHVKVITHPSGEGTVRAGTVEADVSGAGAVATTPVRAGTAGAEAIGATAAGATAPGSTAGDAAAGGAAAGDTGVAGAVRPRVGAVVTIANSGPVVPPDQVRRLFQPFQRLTPERHGRRDGYGLGLRSSMPSPARIAPRSRPPPVPRAAWPSRWSSRGACLPPTGDLEAGSTCLRPTGDLKAGSTCLPPTGDLEAGSTCLPPSREMASEGDLPA